MHIVNKYAYDVTENKILTGKYEKLACQRHLNDLEKSKYDDFPYTFDETRADRIIKWFTHVCRHVKGVYAGQLIQLKDWQCFDIGCAFGWVRKDTGKRRFNVGYIRIARGHAKSTIMSAIAQYGMNGDCIYPPGEPELARFEHSPEIVIGATDRKQAGIVWESARQMGLSSPDIAKRMVLNKTKMAHKTRGGEIQKLSKDSSNKDGYSPCIIIIDEYHAHKTSLVRDITSSGKGKRSQSLEFIITTAGEDAENSPCFIEDNICKSVLDGDIELDNYFVMIREIDKDDDIHDSKNWVKANPFFRDIETDEYARNLFEEVSNEHKLAYESNDNAKIRQWLIKRVNRFQASSQEKYMDGYMEDWKKLAVNKLQFEKLIKGSQCYVGADLSKCIDLTAIGVCYLLEDGRIGIKAHGFIPEKAVKKHKITDKIPYDSYGKQGWCSITKGAVTNDNDIIDYIHNIENEILEFCYDPYGSRQLANTLDSEGMQCVEIKQTFSMLSEATKKFREYIIQGKIVHDGNPLLTWCLSNAYEIVNQGEMIRLSKKHKDDSQRIDLLASVINAFVRVILSVDINPYADGREVDFA